MHLLHLSVLALLLVSSTMGAVASADEVLQNGDFSEGLTHWEGDCRPLSVATDSMARGAAVELLSTWAKMTQNFEAKRGRYVISVTFTMTPDTTFEGGMPQYRKIPKKLGFGDLTQFNLQRGEWCILVTNIAARRYDYCAIKPLKKDSAPQTMTCEITLTRDDDEALFCLGFPPGHGVITLQNVSMTPK